MRAQTIHGKTHHSTTTLENKNKNKNGGNPVFIGVHLYRVRIHDLLREGGMGARAPPYLNAASV
jgi:hypothetical protein